MATVVSVSGSPSPTSRTGRLLRHLDARLGAQGHRVVPLDVRTLPAEALLGSSPDHPAIVRVARLLGEAEGVVIGTPVYKAAYSGLLKTLLDLLPQYALEGKTVLPLATGGSPAHVLAVDYALRPVLASMGAGHIVQGRFVLDRHIVVDDAGGVTLEDREAVQLYALVDAFGRTLTRAGGPGHAVEAVA